MSEQPLMHPAEAYKLGLATALPRPMSRGDRKVILASSVGTIFEWYDFYLFGSLAVVIGVNFFSQHDETTRNFFALLAFAAAFIIRPLGALVFGSLGDMIGRKATFLLTILIMGTATTLVALLPGSATIGIWAPILLILLRLAQGLALGGEYGGAVTYVAEHAPTGRRGLYTGFIQLTATAGLLLSLLVILATQTAVGPEAFMAWGWRIPFALSLLLLVASVWIRLHLDESPAFLRIKAAGTRSRAPVREAFGTWRNARWALLALFGLTMGQAVIWYGGQFYALYFMQTVLKVDSYSANILAAWALLLGCPFFVIFGAISDRFGRKPIILGGCALAALSYFPIFHTLSTLANPDLHRAQQQVAVVLEVDPASCSFQFNPAGTARYAQPCDMAKAALNQAGVRYGVQPVPGSSTPLLRINGTPMLVLGLDFPTRLAAGLAQAGYPSASNPSIIRLAHPGAIFDARAGAVVFLLWLLVLYVTMVYGPIAAALVELFPTRIRYTGMSLPYHIGNGWFGGLLPAVALVLALHLGDPLGGLWYPVVIAALCAIIGALLLPETKDREILDDTMMEWTEEMALPPEQADEPEPEPVKKAATGRWLLPALAGIGFAVMAVRWLFDI